MLTANLTNTFLKPSSSTTNKLLTKCIVALLLITLAACNSSNSEEAGVKNVQAEQNSVSNDAAVTVTAVLETSAGTIVLALNSTKAPASVANFVQYVNDGYYDGTIFHRVINNFMIQGGGFDAEMLQKSTRAPIINEADNGLLNSVGTIAMARTNVPHSATSQFFINVKDNSSLDHSGKNAPGWGYAVFGSVIEGIDVVNNIKEVATRPMRGHGNVPVEPIVITKAYIR